MGQLGHIDCHHLGKTVIRGQHRKLYLLCVLDDYSRLAWAEVMEDITALTTMFTALRCMQAIKREFGIQFEEIIADNGPEFGTSTSLNKKNHPFERMLIETGIKRRYMKPYGHKLTVRWNASGARLKKTLLKIPTLTALKSWKMNYLSTSFIIIGNGLIRASMVKNLSIWSP
jgi:hypothetical protein